MPPKYFDFRMIVLWAIFLIFIITFAKLGSDNILDTRLYYTAHEAAKFFNTLSEKDVFHYLATAYFDLGFIVVYTAMLYLSIKRVFYKVPKLKYFAFIPGLLDFFETKTFIECLNINSHVAENYRWLGYLTLYKWLTGGILLLLFLIKFLKLTYVKIKYQY